MLKKTINTCKRVWAYALNKSEFLRYVFRDAEDNADSAKEEGDYP